MKIITVLLLMSFCLVTMAAGNTLEEIKEKGVLRVGVGFTDPGFGFKEEKADKVVGYDVDFAQAIADRLKVKLDLRKVNDEERIPQLLNNRVDIIIATLTKTPERARNIDFSYTYFMTGQMFLTRKGEVRSLSDLLGKKIGTSKGTTTENNLKSKLKSAIVVTYEDVAQALQALKEGKLFAVSSDGSVLAGLLAQAPDKDRYEIARVRISNEPYGIGVRKGESKLLAFIDQALLEMEKSGEAEKIFNKWFGPKSPTPLERIFKITEGK